MICLPSCLHEREKLWWQRNNKTQNFATFFLDIMKIAQGKCNAHQRKLIDLQIKYKKNKKPF